MRLLLAILAGWLIYFPLFILFSLLFTFISGLQFEYSSLSKDELVKLLSQSPGSLVKIGVIFLMAQISAISVSSFLSGLLARKKGLLIGVCVSLLPSIIGIIGSIFRGSSYIVEIMPFFAIILCIGTIFGFLGEKIYKTKLNT